MRSIAPNTPPALVQVQKLLIHRFLDQIGQFFHDKRSLQRIFVFGQAKLLIDNQLDGHRPAHTFFGGGRDGLVVGIGMQRVTVVIHRQ